MIRTPDQRLRVFVSSTLGELADERRAVRRAIESLRLSPVMFEMGARPHPPQDLYRAYLEQSDIFVGIYWERYGWIGPGMEISGLEDEYRLSGAKPRLVYVKRPAPAREARLESILEEMRSNGSQAYKEFFTPEELGELVMDDLAVLLSERFGSTPTAENGRDAADDGVPGNLPLPPYPLIGREQELVAAATRLLDDRTALLTLVGPGGSGKTRLALEIGLRLRERFPDGVFVARLEAISDPGLVLRAIAATLGVTEGSATDLSGLICRRLQDSHLLLIVDNFEHVTAAAPDLARILESCPAAQMIVTSRAPLRIRAERLLRVNPLPVPPPHLDPDPDELLRFPAVRLFLERSRDVKPDFALSSDNAMAVSAICRRLDGLPLAVELAAARTRLFTPAMLLERLEKRLETLGRGYSDLPERQSTLRTTIEWSYHLLSKTERRLFRALSTFSGSFGVEAAEHVGRAIADAPDDVLAALEALIDNSLLQVSDGPGAPTSILMLETIKEYAEELLLSCGESEEARIQHAAYYRSYLACSEDVFQGGDAPEWYRRTESELGNLRAAMAWGVANGDPDLTLDIATRLWLFWWERGHWREGLDWLERGLACGVTTSPGLRARALTRSGWLREQLSDLEGAIRLFEESIQITTQIGDRAGHALALSNMGVTLHIMGRYAEATRALREALATRQELGIKTGIYATMLNLGITEAEQGHGEAAVELFLGSLALAREADDGNHVGLALLNLGEQYAFQGDFEAAEDCYQELNVICGETERPVIAGYLTQGKGFLALRRGDLETAQALLTDALAGFQDVGDSEYSLINLEWLGWIAVREGRARLAAMLLAASQASRQSLRVMRQPRYEPAFQEAVAACRRTLGDGEFSAAWTDGTGMTLEAASATAIARGSEPAGGDR